MLCWCFAEQFMLRDQCCRVVACSTQQAGYYAVALDMFPAPALQSRAKPYVPARVRVRLRDDPVDAG
eukprot:3551691-Alexandrium_andersonii.AAC.1